jgi:iron complex transport system substrate-binding protein
MRLLLIASIFLHLFFSCGRPVREDSAQPPNERQMMEFATGFTITPVGQARLVEVLRPYQGATEGYKFLLVPNGAAVPDGFETMRIIHTPIQRMVCTSTTHIPLLDYLSATEVLVGFPSHDYISSKAMRQRIDAGKVAELGTDKGLNMERLIDLAPDLVMGYTMSKDFGNFEKIERMGVPVVINAEYLEEHPLGRAEWIKFVGALLGKEAEADSVFAGIRDAYLHLQSLVSTQVQQRPTVLSGVVYADGWYLPGGRNYAARLLKDAGGAYLWAENSSSGYMNLSFESVAEMALDADFWIGVASFGSLQEMRQTDGRYAAFRAFQQGRVYSYNGRVGAKGGSEFLELGYLRPDLILADLVKILHPPLAKDHTLFFHFELK